MSLSTPAAVRAAQDALPDALCAPLVELLPAGAGPVLVALSGGADSAMLAVAADRVARETGRDIFFCHVHHGLQAEADAWSDHVCVLADMLGRTLDVRRVVVSGATGRGVEASARDARYDALDEAARACGADAVLLAHHRDDQAETVLLRLLRGAGVTGLGAMQRCVERGARVPTDVDASARRTTADDTPPGLPAAHQGKLRYLRPWLGVPRAGILAAAETFAQLTGWHPVSDPTNADPRYTRAAVRTQLSPILDARWPGWQAIVARHARQAEEAAELLRDLARQDLDGLATPGDARQFDLKGWRVLSSARQKNMLRFWLAQHDIPMPAEARLVELQRQLQRLHSLGHDRNLLFNHGAARIRCVRGKVVIDRRPPAQ